MAAYKNTRFLVLVIVISCVSAFASTVTTTVTSPRNGSNVTSPVTLSASAASTATITGWRVYVDNSNVYSTGQTPSIKTSLAMSLGTHRVTVRAWNSDGVYGSTVLTIKVVPRVAVSISPTTAVLQTDLTQQFTANVTGTTNTAVTWSVNGIVGGSSTVGTISSTGLYRAPSTVPTGTITVRATSAADSTKYANAAVTVSASPTPVSISITPTSTSLTTGTSKQFSATVSGTTNTSVLWSVNGVSGGSSTLGTISSTGLYTAPATVPSAGSVTVTATSAYDTSRSASATATVTTASTPVSVAISPTSATVQTAGKMQFAASVSGTTNTSVTWQVNGITGGNSTVGTIASGLYTAPTTVPSGGVAQVTAVSAYDTTKSATSRVTVSAPTVTAGDWFVSPTGSNSNPCTQASPCADPAWVANNKAAPGDTVLVASGTYNYGSGYAGFRTSGSAGNYIHVVCATRGTCKIQNSVTGNATVVLFGGNYIELNGFDVTNTGSGNNMAMYVQSSNILIKNNTIHGISIDCSNMGGGGIQLANGVSNIVMDGNKIYDIGWPSGGSAKCGSGVVQFDGILAETTGGGVVITNNIVYHVSGGWGILYGNSSGNSGSAVISNNTVFSNANGGIAVVNGGDYSTISNNMVVNNGLVSQQCGIWTIYAADSHILMSRNNVYGNLGGDYCSAGAPIKSGNMSVNPASGTLFANWQADGSGDYHLKAGSPAIDAGSGSCASGSPAYITPGVCAPAKDFDGTARPQGTSWDIGANEYH